MADYNIFNTYKDNCYIISLSKGHEKLCRINCHSSWSNDNQRHYLIVHPSIYGSEISDKIHQHLNSANKNSLTIDI